MIHPLPVSGAGRLMRNGAGRVGNGEFVLHCIGDVRLHRDGNDCTPKSKKGRALLALLAAEQRPLSRVRIIDLLWSDRQEEQARASLRTLLSDLREQFGALFDDLLVVERERVAIGPQVRTDLADPSLAKSAGDLFEGLDHIDPEFDEWLRLERQRRAVGIERPLAGEAAVEVKRQREPGKRPSAGSFPLGVALALAIGAGAIWLIANSGGLEPNSAPAAVEQARTLLDRRSPDAAEEARRRLIDVVRDEPDNAAALAALAEATMLASDHPHIGGNLPLAVARREARAYSLRAVRLNPELAAGWAALGFSHMATAKAVGPLERAVALEPNNGTYRWQLGRALEYENRYDEAFLHQVRAIELDPNSADPVIGFIRAAGQLDRVQEMKAAVLAFERRRPSPNDLRYVKGYSAYYLSDDANCIRYLEPVVAQGDHRPYATLISCLTALGDTRRAVELSASRRSLSADVLRGDAGAVERKARAMGREFWLRNFESLAAADLLVRAGRYRALIQSFEASYDSVAEFEREGGRVAMEPTAILLAMQMAGRVEEARQLRGLLAKQVRDQREGMAGDTWSVFAKSALALADGQRDRAVALLAQCFPDCFVGDLQMDISQSAYFGRLKGNSKFDELVVRYRQLVNARRSKAGLAPLPSMS